MTALDRPLSAVWTQHPHVEGIVVGAMVIRQRANKHDQLVPETLVLRRVATDTFPMKWETPGGGADFDIDRTLADVAVRELHEETGLVAKDIVCPITIGRQNKHVVVERRGEPSSDGNIFIFKDEEDRHWAVATYIVEVEDDQQSIQVNPVEHSEWAWITEEEAQDQQFSSQAGLGKKDLEFVSPPMRETILEGFRLTLTGSKRRSL